MSIEALKTNLEQTNSIFEEILELNQELNSAAGVEEKNFFDSAIASLETQLKLINNSIPNLLGAVEIKEREKVLPPKNIIAPLASLTGLVVLNKKDRKRFIEELKISEDMLKKLRKGKKTKERKKEEEAFKKPSTFISMASRVFSKQSFRLADSGFQQLKENLRKANMPVLLSTYISTMLFSSLLAFLISVILAVLLSFFKIAMVAGKPYPVFSLLLSSDLPLRLAKNLALSFLAPVATFALFYIYPASQASSIKKKIDGELPFAVIHMSSIAGSGVEPSKIFKILALSPEYPVISKEFKKIMNQVNLYGYDLVTALRSISKSTSSEKLSELLNGISTNISGGGSLQNYLDKKAEETLLDYRLEMKKYSNVAETSMDIYIGILVAAPLIFMVLLILMNVTGMGFGMSMQSMTYFIVGAIAVMNVFFLLFLQVKQPS